ncbi:MAG: TetR/AcrR family transcriptional regulator [Desulfobulbaceae bacterium]|nr:MAG: TetR/AcrR family transcriptional regulator [Desulfobulbaceae bacterium]
MYVLQIMHTACMSNSREKKMTKKKPTTKKAQAAATTKRLIRIATKEFQSKGYAAASTEAIVQRAKVTRGALYHHFKDKKDLFRAVFIEAQKEIGRRIERESVQSDDLWQALVSGSMAFLKACTDPGLQQIVVIDGRSVLGWNAFRDLDETTEGGSYAQLQGCLAELIEQGLIADVSAEPLTHLLSGAMDEVAVWVSQSENPEQALTEAQQSLAAMLHGLKKQSGLS